MGRGCLSTLILSTCPAQFHVKGIIFYSWLLLSREFLGLPISNHFKSSHCKHYRSSKDSKLRYHLNIWKLRTRPSGDVNIQELSRLNLNIQYTSKPHTFIECAQSSFALNIYYWLIDSISFTVSYQPKNIKT